MSEETQLDKEAIASYLGIEAEDLDSFKTSFESEFIRRANVKEDSDLTGSIVGKRMGTIETAIRSAARKAGFGFADGEGNGVKAEDLVELAFSKVTDGFSDKIKTLETDGLKDKDEAFLELQTKYDKLTLRAKEDRELLDATKNEFVTYKEESASRFKQGRIDTMRQQAFNQATFKKGMSDLEKTGFKNVLNESYNLDLDESDNLIVTDKQGNRIANPAVSGTYMGLDDVIRAESMKHNLYPLNDKAGKTNISQNFNTETEKETAPKRQVKRTYRNG